MFSWTILLFVLCGALTPALCCDWLRAYHRLSHSSLTLISVMGGPLTEERSLVDFPVKLYRNIRKDQVESQLVFVRDSLEQISGLYNHDNFSSVTWDTDKLEKFLETINRQTIELNDCVSTNKTAGRSLRNYYRRLKRSTIERTGGSAESWELIRRVTKLHLVQLDLLVTFIRDSAGTSRRRSAPSRQQH